MHTLEWWLLFYFIVFEFSLVFLFIILCYGGRIYYATKKEHDLKIYQEISEHISNNQILSTKLVEHVPIVIQVIKDLEKNKQIPHLSEQVSFLVQNQLLPIVRSYIGKKSWMKRYLLLACFDYYIEQNDYQLLAILIRDKNPIISINAMRIASKIGAPFLLNAILDYLKQAPHFFHAFVIPSFIQSHNWDAVIPDALNTSDIYLKKICYEILKIIGGSSIYFNQAAADCYSENLNLQLAAIRVLPSIDTTHYLNVYRELIHDNNWLIRNTVVKTLSEKKDLRALDLLEELIKDEHWRVRENAAKCLAFYKDRGQSDYEKKNPQPYKEASYFLKIPQKRIS